MGGLRQLKPIRRKLSRAIRLSQHERALDDLMASGLTAEETTALAIQSEVERVRSLPPDEQARYGTQFTDPEALFAALLGRSLAAGWRALAPRRERGRIDESAADSAGGQAGHRCAAPIPSPAVSGPGNNTHRPLALCGFAA